MSHTLPTKQDCFYILEMLETSLIDYSYTHPWAEELIMKTDTPPTWLCELAVRKYQGDQIKAVKDYVFSEPFEPRPPEMEKYSVACLWLRYERRELSWATFLQMAGEVLDSASADWQCETPYYHLNIYGDAYFSAEAEERTKRDYLKDHDLTPWIEVAESRFEPFRIRRMANKHTQSDD